MTITALDTRTIRDLRSAFREFVRHGAPRLLAAGVAVGLAVRLARGGWGLDDLVVGLLVIAAHPFTEWLIHVYILHVRPRGRVTRAIDWGAGRSHRAHHKRPSDIRVQFIHPAAAAGYLVIAALLSLLGPTVMTGAIVFAGLGLVYEWVHFLIHTDVRPRSALYKKVWRAHRLHHYRNENYWLGVTSPFGDMVLGTYPDKNAVEVSPTARTAAAGLSR